MNANDIIPYVMEALGNTLQELHDAWKNDPEKYERMKITCPLHFIMDRKLDTDEPIALSIKVRWNDK